MSDNIRIKTTPGGGEKSVNVQVKQKFDFIEILSLKISQEEAYRRFCSDYGVVVGRVIVNNGLGVPNAKVSVFIPIDDEDKADPETLGLYPFEVITDKDADGIPYNLLPRNSRGKDDCFTPVGTFPSKREILDNEQYQDIYCKYYKYTTTTNESGDFMLFGLPVGTHFLHVDTDLSDIGILSQRPYDAIRQGVDKRKFSSPTKFKGRGETSSLTQIKTVSPQSVTVLPFWGDVDECEVGITRADVDLATDITPHAFFIGSVIGDNEKDSVNKNCKPRRKMGEVDRLTTGAGRIEMIRETEGGGIERFDVEGGEVIDDNGTWAYQIPMNLDYMVTSEDGRLVPSGDRTRGIPTRARVRFRAGMNITGDEGRLRSRARYLIPNNPDTFGQVDYNFDNTVNKDNLAEMSWNKIYTVKNMIPRWSSNQRVDSRRFIGIKDVDNTNFNPFPFNKIDTNGNPLFTILCLIIELIGVIVKLVNRFVVSLINNIIFLLNGILFAICSVLATLGDIIDIEIVGISICKDCAEKLCIGNWNGSSCECQDILGYLPWITTRCGEDEYCVGCKYGDDGANPTNIQQKTFDATTERVGSFRWPGSNNENKWDDTQPKGDAGWTSCIALNLAESFNVFRFDFFNDWINGTLYNFLFKIKTRKKGAGKQRFCDIDCERDDLDFEIEGTDNNEDGNSDNKCNTNYLVDNCTLAKPNPTGSVSLLKDNDNLSKSHTRLKLKEGVIKRYKGELYYPSISRSGYKLFATDLVNLGSIFDNDWEGSPKIYNFMVDTTYNIPPLTAEENEGPNEEPGDIDVSGFDSADKDAQSLILDLSCFGVDVDSINCNNIKRLCEFGVGLDEDREDSQGNIIENNAIIENQDVDNPFIRGAFASLNSNAIPLTTELRFDSGIATDENGQNYLDTNYDIFRNPTNGVIEQYDNSFYFYFGLLPGKTALSKFKTKYVTECIPESDIDFYVVTNSIVEDDAAAAFTGELVVEVIGGSGPFEFVWTGPNGYSQTFTNVTTPINTISNLEAGTYEVQVTDSAGNVTEESFVVPGPLPLNGSAQVSPVTTNGGNDGQILVTAFGGDNSNYVITIISGPTVVSDSDSDPNLGLFENLSVGTYDIRITDAQGQTFDITGLEVGEPAGLIVTTTVTPIVCPGSDTGAVSLGVSGGNLPYTIEWSVNGTVDPAFNNAFGISNIGSGTYSATVSDSNGQTTTVSEVLVSVGNAVTASRGFTDVTCIDSEDGVITVTVSDGTAPYDVVVDGVTQTISTSGGQTVFSNLPPANYPISITDANGCATSAPTTLIGKPELPLDTSGISVITNTDTGGTFTSYTRSGNATGGWGGYTYTWLANGSVTTNTDQNANQLLVTDANGCTDIINF